MPCTSSASGALSKSRSCNRECRNGRMERSVLGQVTLGGMLQAACPHEGLYLYLGYCIQVGTKSAIHLVGSQLMNEAAEGGGQCKHQVVEHGRIPLPREEDLKIGQRMGADRPVLQG